jgi:hypothetical protein
MGMINKKESRLYAILCLCLAIALATLVSAILKVPYRGVAVSVNLTADTNGIPHLFGVSLANTNLRDGVLSVMGHMGLKSSLGVDPLTNIPDSAFTNLVSTLEAMERAGLCSSIFVTNTSTIANSAQSTPLVGWPARGPNSGPVDTYDDVNPPLKIDWALFKP